MYSIIWFEINRIIAPRNQDLVFSIKVNKIEVAHWKGLRCTSHFMMGVMAYFCGLITVQSWLHSHTYTGFIRGILRGVRYAKSLRVLFLHRRSPYWTTLVLYSRVVFIFNEPTNTLLHIPLPPLSIS